MAVGVVRRLIWEEPMWCSVTRITSVIRARLHRNLHGGAGTVSTSSGMLRAEREGVTWPPTAPRGLELVERIH